MEKSMRDLVDDARGKGIVKLVVESDFDYSIALHPFERHLAKAGIPYYFAGDGIGKEGDYEIDLTTPSINYLIRENAKQIIEKGAEVYNKKGMACFESWVDEYSGSPEEKECLGKVCDYIRACNSRGNTRIFGIDDSFVERVLNEVGVNTQHQ